MMLYVFRRVSELLRQASVARGEAVRHVPVGQESGQPRLRSTNKDLTMTVLASSFLACLRVESLMPCSSTFHKAVDLESLKAWGHKE